MAVRLAFAVQSQVDPDILVVDEALSVGDAKFQAKCFERLRQLKENGTSILLVTHSSEQIVTHCTKAILLNAGVQLESGEPRRVVNRYMDLLFGKDRQGQAEEVIQDPGPTHKTESITQFDLSYREDCFCTRRGYNPHEYRWGDGTVNILDFYLDADGEPYPAAYTTGQQITLALSIKFHTEIVRPILGITIKTKEGVTVYGANSETLESSDFTNAGAMGTVVQARAVFKCGLAPGDYFISLGVATKQGEDVIPHDRRYDAIHLQVRPGAKFFGLADLEMNMKAQGISA
jgi:lipopolysaccharide transport system ATP-binding protein